MEQDFIGLTSITLKYCDFCLRSEMSFYKMDIELLDKDKELYICRYCKEDRKL